MRSVIRIVALTAVAVVALVALFYGVVLNGFGLFGPGFPPGNTTAISQNAPPKEIPAEPLQPDAIAQTPLAEKGDRDRKLAAPRQTTDAAPAPRSPVPAPDPEPATPPPAQRTARNVTPPNVLMRPTSRFGDKPREEKPEDEEEDPSRLYHRIVVHEPGRLASGDTTIRLAGIMPIAADRTCTDDAGHDWPCGRVATAALRRLIRNRAIDCIAVSAADGEVTATCTVGPQDIGGWLVEQGWAEVSGEGYAEEAETARAEKRGIYRAEWTVAGQTGSGAASLSAFTAPTVQSDPFATTPVPSPVTDGPVPENLVPGAVPQRSVEGAADQGPGLVDAVQGNE